MQNLSESAEDGALGECLPLVADMLTSKESEAVQSLIEQNSADKEETNEIFERSDDFSDLLTNYMLKTVRPRDAARAEAVRFLLKQMRAEKVQRPDANKNEFIRLLAGQLGLNQVQQDALLFLALIAATNRLHWTHMNAHSPIEYARFISAMTDISATDIMQLAAPSSILLKTELVAESSDQICISDEAAKAVRGEISVEEFQQTHFFTDSKPAFALDTFDIDAVDRDIMTRLLRAPGPCMILLYGKPGSGKTELARTLAREAGQKLLLVPPLVEGSHQSRLARVHYTTYFAESSVVLVDEADNILNTGFHLFMGRDSVTPSKSLVNTFLDKNQSKLIFITNDYSEIHESTLRRFHFKVRFDKLSLKQRDQAMDLILKKHNKEQLKEQKFIQDTIKDEFITPGILDSVMQSYGRIETLGGDIDAQAAIPRLIQSHKPEKKKESGLSAGDDTYHVEILNTSGKPEALVETAKAFLSAERRPGAGLNFLLHGLPGTGKTEFVKHVARQCGRDVLFKRGSDLLSMWLGGTEQNIAQAFREAEKNNAILLVDEADTFFQPREQAQRSWEVSQTNEFLNQMENHSTLLFCCTNLIGKLDAASMRRFHFKLEFRAMAEEGRADFFADYFKDLLADIPPKYELQRVLSRLTTLTPGDFRAVKQRYAYRPTASVAWQELVSELAAEGSYKKDTQGKAIGF
jgi:transitional endoplasmic reticulum ATPase